MFECHLMSGLTHQRLEADAFISQAALQRAFAHRKFSGYRANIRATGCQTTSQNPLGLLRHRIRSSVVFKAPVQFRCKNIEQFLVVSDEKLVEVFSSERNAVDLRVELDVTAEVALKCRP